MKQRKHIQCLKDGVIAKTTLSSDCS